MHIAIFLRRAGPPVIYVVIIALIMLSGGCCTQSLIGTSRQAHTYLFNPHAVYQSTDNDTCALEGVYSNRALTTYMTTPQSHAYITFSRTNLASQLTWTNAQDSIRELRKLPAPVALRLQPKSELPPGFEKVTDLPPNDIALEIDQTYPNRARVIFIPFALAADIVLLPVELVELPVVLAFARGGPG